MKIPTSSRMWLILLFFLLLPQFVRATTTIVQVGPGGGRTFSPATVTIAPGDTVEWDWFSSPHSATSGTGTPDGLFDSGVHSVPFTFTHVFPSEGSFPYYCTIHGIMMSGTVNVVAATPTPGPTSSPSPAPTATPTPAVISISGTLPYCFGNPTPGPVPGVTLTLTGTASGSMLSDASGNYQFSSLPSGGTYTVTPTKAALPAGSAGISTTDVLAIQRHFLGVTLLTGCRLVAADVTGDSNVTTVDVLATQRFFLGETTGFANVGKYSFSPVNRSYSGVIADQTSQNYDTLVFGDAAGTPVHRPDGQSEDAAGDEGEVRSMAATISLPNIAVDRSSSRVTAAVTASAIDEKNNLVGFQGDFTFDSRVIRFENEPVRKTGLTSGDWNVSGNVLPGTGPIRTLRVSAYSRDFRPLSGEGTLFELRVRKVSKAQGTQLLWAARPNQFFFIDADLHTHRPGSLVSGNVEASPH